MFRSILFPVDFSDRCAEAAGAVAAIARQFNSKITLINAVGDYTNVYTPDAPSPAAWYEWLMHNAETKLDMFGTPCLDPYVTERIVVEGDPAEIVTRYAASEGVDLIVMPTHGRGAFRRMLLGSVTSKLLHDSGVPIWTLTHTEARTTAPPGDIRTILCAIDLSPDNCRVIEKASGMAAEIGASVRIVHAIPVPVSPQAVYLSSEFTHSLKQSAKEEIALLQEEVHTAFPVTIEAGEVPAVVENAAEEFKADLVVIGRGVMRKRFGGLRSNVGPIIRDSPCSVLSL